MVYLLPLHFTRSNSISRPLRLQIRPKSENVIGESKVAYIGFVGLRAFGVMNSNSNALGEHEHYKN